MATFVQIAAEFVQFHFTEREQTLTNQDTDRVLVIWDAEAFREDFSSSSRYYNAQEKIG